MLNWSLVLLSNVFDRFFAPNSVLNVLCRTDFFQKMFQAFFGNFCLTCFSVWTGLNIVFEHQHCWRVRKRVAINSNPSLPIEKQFPSWFKIFQRIWQVLPNTQPGSSLGCRGRWTPFSQSTSWKLSGVQKNCNRNYSTMCPFVENLQQSADQVSKCLSFAQWSFVHTVLYTQCTHFLTVTNYFTGEYVFPNYRSSR